MVLQSQVNLNLGPGPSTPSPKKSLVSPRGPVARRAVDKDVHGAVLGKRASGLRRFKHFGHFRNFRNFGNFRNFKNFRNFRNF